MSSQRNILSQWKFYVIFQFNLTVKWLVLSVSVAGDIMSLWVFLSSWLSHAHRAAHTDRNLHKCNTSAHLLNSAPTPRPPPQTHTYSTCMYTETHTCTAHTPTTHLHIQSYVGIPVHNCTRLDPKTNSTDQSILPLKLCLLDWHCSPWSFFSSVPFSIVVHLSLSHLPPLLTHPDIFT